MSTSIRRSISYLLYLSLFSGTAFATDVLTQEQQNLKHQKVIQETEEALRKAKIFLREESKQETDSITKDESQTDRTIKRITVDQAGRSVYLDFDSVIKQYEEKPLTTKQVFALVKDLTDVLYRAGYVTSAIGLKNNVADKNELDFIVHWGYVNDYLVNGEKPSSFKDKAMVFTLPSLKNKLLNVYDVDQLVEILNTTNKSAEIKVIAADKEGESNFNLVTNRTYLPKVTLGFNNSGAENNANGRNQITASVNWSDLLGTNDSWYFSTGYRLYKGHKKNSQQNYLLSYSQPFSTYTLDIKVSQSDSKKEIKGIHSYNSEGKIKTANIKLAKVLSRNKDMILSAYGELEFKTKKNYIGERLVSHYNNNKLTIGLSYIKNFLGGKLYNDISYSNGLGWFGANSLAYNSKGDKTLSLLSGTMSWYKSFALQERPLNYQLRLGFQYSPYSLYGDNQFSIGDEYTVRGFKGGIISGDSGYYLSQTVDIPFYPEKMSISQVKPFLGIDFGRTFNHAQNDNETLVGAAVGTRIQVSRLNLSFTYSKPIKNVKTNKGDSNIYYVNGSISF
ncbi:ShlB/FhaC/HecB family hemolysin secretion/activation protein [Rodentibacter pneumotropicus]|uniref:ShlB/FhaC/HecB family hemolysin secretion/activation protein n=1 Tax=Rodentibacter pneumotropicus TaxID=758 RepID=UPI00109D652E|nr:ShlB/FhaC/HecB family hemolysin secretion/activation protein [Rodentibacter pneumotropicus]NBH76306.1 ShlB/FhaC/HecB family hemolysin secretion/activation protein [Rodentibacter pneumotropicus]THA03141.1 ShlB/FhaC/HecB family hemolysin secretion/activation protein [Rodentibacter pneumotropicus]THA09535.1 ShlB/FhaC/HecB family hemolysin secretion/activation protein [Rodentibacter pneumotropicus]